MQRSIKKTEGFTLVEMLVSLALFSTVLILCVSTLLVLIDANGRAQNMQTAMTNLSFALDSMTREIRTGYDWYCHMDMNDTPFPAALSSNQNCLSGNGITISESKGTITGSAGGRISYYFNSSLNPPRIFRRIAGIPTPNPLPNPIVIIDPNLVSITDFRVNVYGSFRQSVNGSIRQPTATIYIAGTVGTGEQQDAFALQTTVTQRLPDF